jgi:hypothetical protein
MLLRFAPQLGLASLIVIAMLGAALKIQATRLDKAKAALAASTAAHARDIATVRAAQDRANADWQAQLGRLAATQRRQKDDTDRKADTATILYRDRVLRLPGHATAEGIAARSGLPGAGLPPRADGPGADTLILARADALICAENSARLAAAHDWAKGLISDGSPVSP